MRSFPAFLVHIFFCTFVCSRWSNGYGKLFLVLRCILVLEYSYSHYPSDDKIIVNQGYIAIYLQSNAIQYRICTGTTSHIVQTLGSLQICKYNFRICLYILVWHKISCHCLFCHFPSVEKNRLDIPWCSPLWILFLCGSFKIIDVFYIDNFFKEIIHFLM